MVGEKLNDVAKIVYRIVCNKEKRIFVFLRNFSRKMYYVKKRIEVAMAHKLSLPYESKCTRLHGHNAIITVYCSSATLDENGMVVDFKKIKRIINDMLDHRVANDVVSFNPTAENLARHICLSIDKCYKVSFQETEGNVACYVKDGAVDIIF